MSTTTIVAADAPSVGAQERCTVCEHTADRHDGIGRRFCDATQSQALSRKCICRPA